MDSCKSKEIYIKDCTTCPSNTPSSPLPQSVQSSRRSNDLPSDSSNAKRSLSDKHSSDKHSSNDPATESSESDKSTNRIHSSNSVSNVGPDMQNLPIANQYLPSDQFSHSSTSFQPQSYHQMNIQNNSLNFRYSPQQQQYANLCDQQQMASQMTNYMLSNNVNNLNLNSPTTLHSPLGQPNQFLSVHSAFGASVNQLANLDQSYHTLNLGNDQLRDYSNRPISPSPNAQSNVSSSNSRPGSPNQPTTDLKELKTFNFQNRTHVHGFQNNFEPDHRPTSQSYKDDYKSDDDAFSDYEKEENKNKNKFLSPTSNRPTLPMSNVDLSPAFSSAAPRTGSASPISSYNSPTVVESRNKKKKFNFKMRKFKIKGKKSPNKQSKKSSKSQKSKTNPGLLYSQLNKGINSGTLNSINKMQLSILNTGLIPIEAEKASGIIVKEPFDLSTNKFIDHLDLLRKYPVLFKIEYFVSCFLFVI